MKFYFRVNIIMKIRAQVTFGYVLFKKLIMNW